jgi:hypothetical protein
MQHFTGFFLTFNMPCSSCIICCQATQRSCVTHKQATFTFPFSGPTTILYRDTDGW